MTIPEPETPCPEGYHWVLRSIPYPPYGAWDCVKEDDPELLMPVTQYPAPHPPAELPWPFNFAHDTLTGGIDWLGDTVNWGIGSIQGGVNDAFGLFGIDLSEGLDWLFDVIDSAIKASQTIITNEIKRFQEAMAENIAVTQQAITQAITDVQGGFDIVVSGGFKLLDDSIKSTQEIVGVQVKSVHTFVDSALNFETGLVPTLIRGVPEAIFTFLNTTIGPVLKGFNDVLEEI